MNMSGPIIETFGERKLTGDMLYMVSQKSFASEPAIA